MNLDEMLKGEFPTTEVQPLPDVIEEAPPAEVIAPTPTQENKPTGEVPAQQPSTSAPPDAEQSQRSVPLQALQEERKKRQEIQQRLDDLERRLVSQQTQTQPKAEQWEWTEDKILGDMPGAFRTAEQRMQQLVNDQLTVHRYQQSEIVARQIHRDYDEIIGQYSEVAKQNPALAGEVHNSAAPALIAYQAVKRHLETQAANDPATRETEVQQRVQAELAKLRGTLAADGVPRSITSARGSGAATPPANTWSGPPPLGDILRRK